MSAMTDILLEGAADRIAELKADNEKLRKGLIELSHEKQKLEDVIARQDIYIKQLRRQYGLAAHDFEPEVD